MTVSVVIANFNNAPFIEQSISSVMDDPVVSEIVLYDDCSTDSSIAIAEGIGCPKLQIIRGKANAGATVARHAAVLASSREYICQLDGDDYVSPSAVSTALRMLQIKSADLSLFNLVLVAPNGERLSSFGLKYPLTGREAFERSIGGWDIHGLGVVRREVYNRAHARFTPHGYSDDEILARLIMLESEVVCGNRGKYFYRKIVKPVTPAIVEGLLRNRLRSIKLARSERIAPERIAKERRMAARNLAGVFYRAGTGRFPLGRAVSLLGNFLTA